MKWHRTAGAAAIFAASLVAEMTPASAQTFDSYRCADGTHFILAFYPGDTRAYLQIDGRPVTLKNSLSISGRSYSGSGVSLVMTATGIRLKHLRRPVTACELS
jgi:membrane-bound inhibitor of C-type lysozyme